jgi:hypothetical protein
MMGQVRFWPEASVRCLAAIRPESGVKPTCRDSWTDAIDPKRISLTRAGAATTRVSLVANFLASGLLARIVAGIVVFEAQWTDSGDLGDVLARLRPVKVPRIAR